jgi:hypothetical protein
MQVRVARTPHGTGELLVVIISKMFGRNMDSAAWATLSSASVARTASVEVLMNVRRVHLIRALRLNALGRRV